MSKGYIVSLAQSLSITNGINFLRESLERKEITEENKKYLTGMMGKLKDLYSVNAMELRMLTMAGEIYCLTNSPRE
jgi:hypothetical protein